MKFSIINLGCKVNAYEAESVASDLIKRGWIRTNEDDYDAVLIFTCAVTNTAAAKSRKMLHRAKRIHPSAITAVVGCYVQVDDGLLNDADILVGTANKNKLPDYLEQCANDHQKIRDIGDLTDVPFTSLNASMFDTKARGDLKIQDGCNQFCSYCIIPYVRGRERSIHPDMAIAQAKKMSEKYHEIVLTGIHTGRYGKEYNLSLAGLIKRILQETKDTRIRISSIEITEVTDELIALMKMEPRITRFLHIPLQSGSDAVLKRMHRPYTTQQFYTRIQEIRAQLGNISISTDLIVGFPQETETEFVETYEFLKKCEFSFLHVFPYSVRQGTVAADMPCQVDAETKKIRARKCIALSEELSSAYYRQFENTEADIICEWVKDGYTSGHTSEYIPVKIEEELVHGEVVHVQLLTYQNGVMLARKLGESNEVK